MKFKSLLMLSLIVAIPLHAQIKSLRETVRSYSRDPVIKSMTLQGLIVAGEATIGIASILDNKSNIGQQLKRRPSSKNRLSMNETY